ncbi:MAG: YeeE/YedE family protein [Desulfobacterales bacterium]|nr:YeeE/YedE family protein [Desulfobacterales bacterium]
MDLLLGLITGILFGFFLQKGLGLRFEKHVGLFRLIDMTILKIMLTAIGVGMVGIYLFADLGVISLSPKATSLGAQIIGGLIFGIGWATLGFCPGTIVGALGEGRWHAIWGIIGMLVGAAIYAEVYPALASTVITWGSYGKISIPDVLGINHWIVIVIFIAIFLGLFKFFEKKNL